MRIGGGRRDGGDCEGCNGDGYEEGDGKTERNEVEIIDNVESTEDEHGIPTIRAVDIKTDGSMGVKHSFETTLEGSEPQSEDELNLLRRHGIQLAIYHEALEEMNLQTPEESRRLLLPPAIVWARNGRMIAYPDNMLRDLRSELGELLSLTARTHLNPVEKKSHNLGNPQ